MWITREIYPTVSSMCDLKLDGVNSWALTHAPREIAKYLETFPGDHVVRRVFEDVIELDAVRQKELGIAALCWLTKDRSRRHALTQHGGSIAELSYANLISDTKKMTRWICEFLGVEWSERMLQHHKYSRGKRPGRTVPSRPVDVTNDQKWRNALSKCDVVHIDSIIKSTDYVM